MIDNICTNPQFPKLNLRVGRDLCSKGDTTIPATGTLRGLTLGRDYVNSIEDPEARTKAEEKLEQGFLLGQVQLPSLARKRQPVILPRIAANEREADFVRREVLIDDDGDIDDNTRVTFNVFTFPIQRQ